jgi:hypothetical protein
VIFIISGAGAAIWSETNFGLTDHHLLEVVSFFMKALFPILLPRLHACWKSCSVRVFSTASDSALTTSVLSKMAVPQLYLFSRKQENRRRPSHMGREWGMAVTLFLIKNFPLKNGAHFHAFTIKVTIVCRIDCLACQDKFFMNNLPDIKENVELSLDFALHLSHLWQSQ